MRLERTVVLWLAIGWIGYAILPWYAIDGGFWSFDWLIDDWPLDDDAAPALLQAAFFGKWWLWPIILPLLAPLALAGRRRSDPAFAHLLIAIGLVGLVLASRAEDGPLALFGGALFVFAVLFEFGLIRRVYDAIERAQDEAAAGEKRAAA